MLFVNSVLVFDKIIYQWKTNYFTVSKWYDVIGNEVITDAVLDRIVHSSHRFDLKGESLRKKL